MKRTPVNPWEWNIKMGFNQGEVVEGVNRQLFCSGQTAMDASGMPSHPGDMRAQINMSLNNLEAVLEKAGMNLGHIVRLGVHTLDVDEALRHFDLMAERFGPHNIAPPMTLLGVSRLAVDGLLFEIEATAMAE